MADIKISELLPASTPLDGTETLPIVQSGNTVKASTQDIASLYSLGYTAEDVDNKSTDSTFAGATDLKYPSQLAVKTYVDNTLGNAGWGLSGNSGTTSANFIGTTDAQDFVLKTNNTERLKLNASGGIVSSTYINVSNGVNSSVVGLGYLALFTASGISQIQSDYVTGSKLLQLPNVNNKFLAVSVNGQPADANGNVTLSVTGGWGLTGNSGTTAATNFIGTTDNVDLVLKANNSEVLRITSGGANPSYAVFKGIVNSIDSIEASFYATNPGFTKSSWITSDFNYSGKPALAISETFIGNIRLGTLTGDRTYSLPDKSGTLAIEDYLVYTALIDWNGGSPIATVLKNTIGASITWASVVGINGYMRGTIVSGTPFTSKTWISNGSYISGDSYFVYGKRRNIAPTTQIEYYFYKYDNTSSSTPNFTSFPVEIRIYP